MKGSLKPFNQRGEKVWRLQWRENGRGRTAILGKVREMTRAEAETKRKAILAPLNADRPPLTGLSVADYVREEYLGTRNWKKSTEATTTDIIERYILDPIGKRLLAEVTRKELQTLLNGLVDRAGSSIIKRVRFQLQAIFNLAHADGKILVNPAAANVLETPRAAREAVPPEIGDRDAIARAVMGLPVRERLFLMLATWRGIRPGEVSALKVGDIEGDRIHIRRRVYRGIIDTPKSQKGLRVVPGGALATLIGEHLATLPDASPDAWLFPSETGKTPINYNNLYRRRLRPALEAVGLKRFNFQAMRATFATLYREVEPDAKVRADMMGHTVDVHEHVYRQSTERQRIESIEKLDGKLQ